MQYFVIIEASAQAIDDLCASPTWTAVDTRFPNERPVTLRLDCVDRDARLFRLVSTLATPFLKAYIEKRAKAVAGVPVQVSLQKVMKAGAFGSLTPSVTE